MKSPWLCDECPEFVLMAAVAVDDGSFSELGIENI
jgi:hypothetical protein